MRVERHDDADALLDAAERILVANEANNHLLLGICDVLRRNGSTTATTPFLSTVYGDDGAPIGVAIMTPPHHVVVSAMPPGAINALVDHVTGAGTASTFATIR